MEPLVGLRQSESRTVLKVRGPAAATALTADWRSDTEVHLAWNVEGSPPLTVRFDRPHSPATLASAALGDGLWLVHADRPADAGLGEGVAWSTGDGRAGRALFLTPDAVRAAVAAMQRGQDAWKLAAA